MTNSFVAFVLNQFAQKPWQVWKKVIYFMGPELRFSPVQILSLRPYNNEKSWNDVSDIVQLAQVKHDQKHKKLVNCIQKEKSPAIFFWTKIPD